MNLRTQPAVLLCLFFAGSLYAGLDLLIAPDYRRRVRAKGDSFGCSSFVQGDGDRL